MAFLVCDSDHIRRQQFRSHFLYTTPFCLLFLNSHVQSKKKVIYHEMETLKVRKLGKQHSQALYMKDLATASVDSQGNSIEMLISEYFT
jgi:hypothetical protein